MQIFDEIQLKNADVSIYLSLFSPFWSLKFRYYEIYTWKIDLWYHFFHLLSETNSLV